GDGTFRDQVRFGVGAPSPNYLLAADLNGDGRLDLVTTNDTVDHPASLSVLLGNGDGTFRAPARFAVGTAPRAVAEGDFNGDGRPDLAVSNFTSNDLSVLLGNGDGTFRDHVRYGVVHPRGLLALDLDGDGRTDLVSTDSNTNGVTLFLGLGDGTF